MLGPVARTTLLGRNVMRTFVRNESHGGVPGQNLPFDIHNRTKLTFYVFWYTLTGIAAPFLIVLHQLKKK
ncbi:unnamed protein product [Euphydryas editha]|uniref:Cytochrome c oxidase subunit 7C, mitochondrial n=1 Tax=Euphydryas editha TaxID=104508 RepID=A0AAU9TB35_EUPED|nr:unnamed protein product [Euphydryas editha]